MTEINSLNDRERRILISIHDYFTRSPALDQIQEIELKTLMVDSIPLGFTMPTIRKMVSGGLIALTDSNLSYGETAYVLTDTGLSLADELIRSNTQSPAADSGSSDDEWQPLPWEWQEPHLDNAIQAVENALDRVRGDNGFASAKPETHQRLVWSLSAGLEGLRKRTPDRKEIFAMLYKPLKWLAENFAKSALGEVGKAAGNYVGRLLGLTF